MKTNWEAMLILVAIVAIIAALATKPLYNFMIDTVHNAQNKSIIIVDEVEDIDETEQ